MSSRPCNKRWRAASSIVEGFVKPVSIVHPPAFEVDGQLVAGIVRDARGQRGDRGFGQHDREQPVGDGVAAENVRERRRDDRAKAVIRERPGGVFA